MYVNLSLFDIFIGGGVGVFFVVKVLFGLFWWEYIVLLVY